MRLEGASVTSGGGSVLTLDEAKDWLRVSVSDDDAIITDLANAATLLLEGYTQRAFLTTGISASWSCVETCDVLQLPKPPFASVTSVAYLDSDGNSTLIAAGATGYELETSGELAQIHILSDLDDIDASRLGHLTVAYSAGYGAAADVPSMLMAAVRWALSSLYDSCDEVGRPNQTGIERAYQMVAQWRVQNLNFAAV